LLSLFLLRRERTGEIVVRELHVELEQSVHSALMAFELVRPATKEKPTFIGNLIVTTRRSRLLRGPLGPDEAAFLEGPQDLVDYARFR
jgi:hypothetical protein